MKVSEVISQLAEYITLNDDEEIGEDFIIHAKYGQIEID